MKSNARVWEILVVGAWMTYPLVFPAYLQEIKEVAATGADLYEVFISFSLWLWYVGPLEVVGAVDVLSYLYAAHFRDKDVCYQLRGNRAQGTCGRRERKQMEYDLDRFN